jgi:hypothetical protein
MYLNKRIIRRRQGAQSMGDAWTDWWNSVTGGSSTGTDPNAPVIDVTGSGEDVNTGPVFAIFPVHGGRGVE